MIYYAIRHIPTGKFLPQLRKKRGHTHTEPMDMDEAVPRLHKKKQSAKVALYWWLQGKGSDVYTHSDWEGYGAEYAGVDFTKQPDRKAEEMEIVPVTVSVPPKDSPAWRKVMR